MSACVASGLSSVWSMSAGDVAGLAAAWRAARDGRRRRRARRAAGRGSTRTARRGTRTGRRAAPAPCAAAHLVDDDRDEPLESERVDASLRQPVFEPLHLREPRDVARLRHRRRQERLHDRQRLLRRRPASRRASARWRRCARGRSGRASAFRHIAARMPRTLLAAIAEPSPAPSMTMPASASPRGDRLRHAPRRHRDNPPASRPPRRRRPPPARGRGTSPRAAS